MSSTPTNSFTVRIDNTQVDISGTEMTAADAAEKVACERWPWLRECLNKVELVESVNEWRMYRLHYTRDGQPSSGRVAVRRHKAVAMNGSRKAARKGIDF
jgi:hypothetical protein